MRIAAFASAALLCGAAAHAQDFDSGSDGSDGALELVEGGTIVFDPADFDPPLDADGDGVYHFTRVNVAAGVTVRLRADVLGVRPVVWLVQEDATIGGTLDLSGEAGHAEAEPRRRAIGGAGGWDGGSGGNHADLPMPGGGPGGGSIGRSIPDAGGNIALGRGGGAGYARPGTAGVGAGGPAYGNRFLLPLLGGSGGAGGGHGGNVNQPANAAGGGGGGGGGALMLAVTGTLTVGGLINADGGAAGAANGQVAGGGGSGGAIRLVARSVRGGGGLNAEGGSAASAASDGRIRIESYDRVFAGRVDPIADFSTPGLLRPPLPPPVLTLEQVGDVEVPSQPVGRFDPPDMVIDASEPVELAIAASQVPPGTVIQGTVWNESTGFLNVESTPLEGDLDRATATAVVGVSHGFSRISMRANWE